MSNESGWVCPAAPTVLKEGPISELFKSGIELTCDADKHLRRGEEVQAKAKYAEAARKTEEALEQIPCDNDYTRGVLISNIALLWKKAGDFERAKKAARDFLATNPTYGLAVQTIEGLLSGLDNLADTA